jgi:hypothetical protein
MLLEEALLEGARAVAVLGAEGPGGADCTTAISHRTLPYRRYEELTIVKVHGYWMQACITGLSIIEI